MLTTTTAVPLDVDGYLRRLGPVPAGAPSVENLALLHAAHVENVPFQTLERAHDVDPYAAAGRIARAGLGGVCYQLNGAFSLLLDALGYRVTLHSAAIESGWAGGPVSPDDSHNVLLVHDLPTDGNPGGTWILDVGSGEGFHRPLPLVAGTHRIGNTVYTLRPSDTAGGDWRIDYDPSESCRGVDFTARTSRWEDFAEPYRTLADGPMAVFFLYGWIKRHHADGFDEVIGCQFTRYSSAGGRVVSTLTSADEWLTVLKDVFELPLDGLSCAERVARWEQVHTNWTQQSLRSLIYPES